MKANYVSLLLLSIQGKELIEQKTHDVGQRHSTCPFYHQTIPDAKTNLHHDSLSTALKIHT